MRLDGIGDETKCDYYFDKPIEVLSVNNQVIGFEYCEDVAGVNLLW
jgi:hypothetical protein